MIVADICSSLSAKLSVPGSNSLSSIHTTKANKEEYLGEFKHKQ